MWVLIKEKDIITSNESTLSYLPLKCFSLRSKLVWTPQLNFNQNEIKDFFN